MAKEENAGCLHIAVSTESDIAELETYEEKQLFLEELGLEDAGVNRVIRAAYDLLELQTYLLLARKKYVLGPSSVILLPHRRQELFTPTLKRALFALR